MLNDLFELTLFIALFWLLSYFAQTKITSLAIRLSGQALYLGLSSVGVVLHELSHAVTAILFGHKVTKISFFSPDPFSPTLGYVNHSYNPTSFYQVLGNFYIGFAPLLLAPASLVCLTYLLLPNPEHFIGLVEGMGHLPLLAITQSFPSLYEYFYWCINEFTLVTILWLFAGGSLALACGPSPTDVKGASKSIIHAMVITASIFWVVNFEIPAVIPGLYWALLLLCLFQISTLSICYLLKLTVLSLFHRPATTY